MVQAAGAEFPPVEAVRRCEEQAFRQKGVLIPFHIKINLSAENIEDFIFLMMDVAVRVKAGPFVAFAVPYHYAAVIKNTIFVNHRHMITALSDFCNVFDDFSNGFNRLPVVK
jgi:hypothetical protein